MKRALLQITHQRKLVHRYLRNAVLVNAKTACRMNIQFLSAVFLSYGKLRFHTIINALRGCALGARVDGCRGNRASARECAKAHSLLSYRKLRFHTIKTLRADRTAAEWKNVACATRRRRRILLRRILFYTCHYVPGSAIRLTAT